MELIPRLLNTLAFHEGNKGERRRVRLLRFANKSGFGVRQLMLSEGIRLRGIRGRTQSRTLGIAGAAHVVVEAFPARPTLMIYYTVC